ncbi:DNRLRE domain-containing protein [Phycisphaerales bacterium AB-hyl4]|uniref:DNRLRE domain-containing protein n=1 Tax=Natronomicrosphaera hydrolytica TaxID=3242702 RepID=A0ABV4U4H6_9BACT
MSMAVQAHASVTETFYLAPSDGQAATLRGGVPAYHGNTMSPGDSAFAIGAHGNASESPYRALLQFGGLDMFASITTATIELTVFAPYNGDYMDVAVHQVTEAWSPGTNTSWNTQPSYEADPYLVQNDWWGGFDSPVYTHVYDVTGLVQAWGDGTSPNYGVLLKQHDESIPQDALLFNNDLSDAPGPRLVVHGVLVPEPGMGSIFAFALAACFGRRRRLVSK